MRALRAGKESYAVIAETLRAFATGRHETEIPIYRMLATPLDVLRARASEIIQGTDCRTIDSAAPRRRHDADGDDFPQSPIEVSRRRQRGSQRASSGMIPPIVGRIVDDRFTIEMRTLSDDDRRVVAEVFRP